jgi:hypothetical protein
MKSQEVKNNNHLQGNTTADRAFTDQKEIQQQRGVSNSGGQKSFQTSSKDSAHKAQKKKD